MNRRCERESRSKGSTPRKETTKIDVVQEKWVVEDVSNMKRKKNKNTRVREILTPRNLQDEENEYGVDLVSDSGDNFDNRNEFERKYKEKYEQKLKEEKELLAKQTTKLVKENEALLRNVDKLNRKVHELKQEREPTEQSNIYFKENTKLKEDSRLLKHIIKKLNGELSYYIEKTKNTNPNDIIPRYSSASDSSTTLDDLENISELNEPKKILIPLLKAYEEVIARKQEIIKGNELAMERFKEECQVIVQENNMLNRIIGENKTKGCVSIEDWQFLHENAVLVLEENDLLHDKIKSLEKNNLSDQESIHRECSTMKIEISQVTDDRDRLIACKEDLENQCTTLTGQIEQMSAFIQRSVSKEVHESSVREYNQFIEDIQRKFAEERTMLTEDLDALLAEKDRIFLQLTNAIAENTQLKESIDKLETARAENEDQMKELQTKLSNASKNQNVTSETINGVLELVKTFSEEREVLEISFREQKTINEQMMTLRVKESELVAELEHKIKMMTQVHQEEIQEHVKRKNDFEDVLEVIGERHRIDIAQLQALINEKHCIIDKLEVEKRQLIDDLETVWRATTKDRSLVRPVEVEIK